MCAALLVAHTAAVSGCYRYVPVQRGAAPADRDVRVELTDAATLSLGPRLGESVVAVDGRIRSQDSAGLVIAATGSLYRSGGTQVWRGESVTLEWAQIARVGARRLDRARTALTAIAIVGGAALVAVAAGTDFFAVGKGRGDTSRPR